MAKVPKSGSCEKFQDRLPELVGAGEHLDHPHLLECERCHALVMELDTIAEAARRLLPDRMP